MDVIIKESPRLGEVMLQLIALVAQDTDPDTYVPAGTVTQVVKDRLERITAHVFGDGPAYPEDEEFIAYLKGDQLVRHLTRMSFRTVKLLDRNGTYALFLETPFNGSDL